jgi:hypothetical protein
MYARALLVLLLALLSITSRADLVSAQSVGAPLFVRKEVNLRDDSSPAADTQGLLRPGTLLKLLEPDIPRAGYVRVQTSDGRSGWVSAEFVRPLEILEVEERLEDLGGFSTLGPEPGRFATLAATKCSASFDACPTAGCATRPEHRAANRLKRRFPKASAPRQLIDFATLRDLQEATDHLGVPQGEVLSSADRAKLKNIAVGNRTFAEGDAVILAGFLAADRTIRCGSRESVNCNFNNGANGPCDKTDIHMPVVEQAGQLEVDGIVVEPVPQGKKVQFWTPPALASAQQNQHLLKIVGSLFYDSQHIVNTGGAGTQPKRFTVWEIHPVSELFICTRADNACDPATTQDWAPLGESTAPVPPTQNSPSGVSSRSRRGRL